MVAETYPYQGVEVGLKGDGMSPEAPPRRRGPTWSERVHLDGFWFWRADALGGQLPTRPPEKLNLSGIWHLLGYLRYAWIGAVGLLITIFAQAYLGVLPAFVVKQIINVDIKQRSLTALSASGLHLAEIFVLLALLSAANGWFGAWASSVVVWRLRQDVLTHQLRLPLHRLVGRGAAATIVRTVNEVGVAGGDSPVFTGIAGVINTVTSSVNNIVTLIAAVIAIFVLDTRLALWSLILLPIPIAVGVWWGRIVYGAIHRQYEKLAEITGFVLGTFSPVAALRDKLLGRQGALAADFRRRNRELTNASIYARVLFHWYDNLFQVIQGSTVGILWLVGGHAILGGTVTLGVVLATITLIGKLDGPIHNLAELWFSLRSLAAVADRVAADLEARQADGGAAADAPAAAAVAAGPHAFAVEGGRLEGAAGRVFASGIDIAVRSGEVLTLLDESPRPDAAWIWAGALAGWYPLASGRLTLDGAPAASGAAAVAGTPAAVHGLTARGLWTRAAGAGPAPAGTGATDIAEARWASLWAQASRRCAHPVPALPPDEALDGAGVTPDQRLLAGVVAAELRGAPVWVVVGEPEGLGVRWEEFGPAVVRVQPDGDALVPGTRWVARRLDGRMESGAGTPAWWAARRPDPGASDAWSTEVLAADGPGWWAGLGLRRHGSPRSARFVEPFKRLFAYMARYWVYWVTILVLGSGAAAVNSAVSPLITKRIIDTGVGHKEAHVLTVSALLLIALSVTYGLANIAFTTTFVQTGGKRMCGDIRDDFFAGLVRTPQAFLTAHSTAEINSRAVNDVNAIFSGTDAMIKMVTWMIIPNIPSMVLLWVLGPRYGVLTLAVAVPFAVLAIWVGRLNARLQERMFAVVGAMTSELHGVGTAARATLIRACNLGEEALDVGRRLNDLLYRLGLVQYLRGNWWSSVEGLWGNAVTVVFWMVGGAAIIRGHLLLGTLTAVMSYAGKYVGMGGGVDSYVAIYGICSNLDRLHEYQREAHEHLQGDTPAALPDVAAAIVVEPVRGAEPPAFRLNPGQVTTLRTPLAAAVAVRQALLGLDGPHAVRVRLGEADVSALPADAWRRSVGWICADYPFGEATVRELLQWAAGLERDIGPGLKVLGLGDGSAELDRQAEVWRAGAPGRGLLLTAALVAAQAPRVVVIEADAEAGPSPETLVEHVRTHVPDAALLVLQPVV